MVQHIKNKFGSKSSHYTFWQRCWRPVSTWGTARLLWEVRQGCVRSGRLDTTPTNDTRPTHVYMNTFFSLQEETLNVQVCKMKERKKLEKNFQAERQVECSSQNSRTSKVYSVYVFRHIHIYLIELVLLSKGSVTQEFHSPVICR